MSAVRLQVVDFLAQALCCDVILVEPRSICTRCLMRSPSLLNLNAMANSAGMCWSFPLCRVAPSWDLATLSSTFIVSFPFVSSSVLHHVFFLLFPLGSTVASVSYCFMLLKEWSSAFLGKFCSEHEKQSKIIVRRIRLGGNEGHMQEVLLK